LRWWVTFGDKWNGRAVWQVSTAAEMATDASQRGWGAEIKVNGIVVPAYGFWVGADFARHITWKELKAVRRTIENYLRGLARMRILLWCDNTAVVRILSNQVSRAPEMMEELRRLWWLLDSNQIELEPHYVNTKLNVADPWSRIPPGEWMVATRFFRSLDRDPDWGPYTIDRFASRCTAQLPRYCNQGPDTWCEEPDAYLGRWIDENNWVVPPFNQIDRAVYHLRETGAKATVVVPDWGSQSWMPDLMAMANRIIEFPVDRDHVYQFGAWSDPYTLNPIMLAVQVG
jgi:hypothetical protein